MPKSEFVSITSIKTTPGEAVLEGSRYYVAYEAMRLETMPLRIGGGAMPVRYAELMGEITGLPPLPIAEMGPPVLTPLGKPLHEARVMILTSAGVHLDDDPPFQHPNDMTFRRIPQSTPPSSLRPSHPTPVRRPGQEDINVVFPYERLSELAREGFIGGVTEYHLSMLGSIKKLRELVTDMAMAMAADAKSAGADVVLHTPL